jgi:tetratricopeptide (TPR) repeat protein
MSSSNRKCLFCLKDVESDLRCSRCRTARYCSQECQKRHWKVHKNLCMDSNSENSIEKLDMKAINHAQQGSYPKAEKLYRKLLNNLIATDNNQTFTLGTMMNLANTYGSQGKHAEAEALMKQRSMLG